MTNSELIETVKGRLIRTYNPQAIYLFGSYAWGNPDEQSDLDLLVVVEKSDEKPYKRPVKGIAALRGLMVANDILVFTIEEFNQLTDDISTLCYKIKQEGVKLYEAA
ncbi:nucleotidyltransferase domain-containing protein [Thermodesulfovibrionales bacterium]|nr:nucleotidyltransferase domain-containing protein [Thermodesulfovibrionales bacterium]MCL0066983.1 nucleotidyltransferase domain-containing protein [Thermodesulfovibrionales bacterium]